MNPVRDPRRGPSRFFSSKAPRQPSEVGVLCFGIFRAENLARRDALVKGPMSKYFVFCYSITRRRADPVEGKNSFLAFVAALQECVGRMRLCSTPQHTQHEAPYTSRHTVHTARNRTRATHKTLSTTRTTPYARHSARTTPHATHPPHTHTPSPLCSSDYESLKVCALLSVCCALLSVCRVLSCLSMSVSVTAHLLNGNAGVFS